MARTTHLLPALLLLTASPTAACIGTEPDAEASPADAVALPVSPPAAAAPEAGPPAGASWIARLAVRNVHDSALVAARDGSTLALVWASPCVPSATTQCRDDQDVLQLVRIGADGHIETERRVPHLEELTRGRTLLDGDALVLLGTDRAGDSLNLMRLDARSGVPTRQAIVPLPPRLPLALAAGHRGGLQLVVARPTGSPDELDDYEIVGLEPRLRTVQRTRLGGDTSPRPFALQSATVAADGSAIAAGVCLTSEDTPRSPPCLRIERQHGFVARWRADGTLAWARVLLPEDDDASLSIYDLVARDDGSVIVHGNHAGTLELRGGVRPHAFVRDSNRTERELFASYGPRGELEWAIEDDATFTLHAVDASGRAWVTSSSGMLVGTIDRGGRWLTPLTSWDMCGEGVAIRPLELAIGGAAGAEHLRMLAVVPPGERICDLDREEPLALPADAPPATVVWSAPIAALLERG